MTASEFNNNSFPLGFGIKKKDKRTLATEAGDTDRCEECDGRLIVTHTGFQVCSSCGLEHQLVHFTRF